MFDELFEGRDDRRDRGGGRARPSGIRALIARLFGDGDDDRDRRRSRDDEPRSRNRRDDSFELWD